MLNIRSEKCLASILGVSAAKLRGGLGRLDRCIREYDLVDPDKPGKLRQVLEVRGYWRVYLDRLYDRLLLPRLRPSIYSHGGVKGRSIVSNAAAHSNSIYGYSIDISNFFPSIHYTRIYSLFAESFGCSPGVSRICTRLCTHDYHLAVGLPTSPILADQILRRVDKRIGAACMVAGLAYTRYVDDVTISGDFNLEGSGITNLVSRIIWQEGFRLSDEKRQSGKLSGGIEITGIRIKARNLDVRAAYIEKLKAELEDAALLAKGSDGFSGRYYTSHQLMGRVRFVCRINPGRKPELLQLCGAIDWRRLEQEAERRGLVALRKYIIPKTDCQKDEGGGSDC